MVSFPISPPIIIIPVLMPAGCNAHLKSANINNEACLMMIPHSLQAVGGRRHGKPNTAPRLAGGAKNTKFQLRRSSFILHQTARDE